MQPRDSSARHQRDGCTGSLTDQDRSNKEVASASVLGTAAAVARTAVMSAMRRVLNCILTVGVVELEFGRIGDVEGSEHE